MKIKCPDCGSVIENVADNTYKHYDEPFKCSCSYRSSYDIIELLQTQIESLGTKLEIAVEALDGWQKESEKLMEVFSDDAISIATAYSRAKRFNSDLGQQIDKALADIEGVGK